MGQDVSLQSWEAAEVVGLQVQSSLYPRHAPFVVRPAVPGAEVQCPPSPLTKGTLSHPVLSLLLQSLSLIHRFLECWRCWAQRSGPGMRTWGLITGLWPGWEVLCFPTVSPCPAVSPFVCICPDILSGSVCLAGGSDGSGAQKGPLGRASPSENFPVVFRAETNS